MGWRARRWNSTISAARAWARAIRFVLAHHVHRVRGIALRRVRYLDRSGWDWRREVNRYRLVPAEAVQDDCAADDERPEGLSTSPELPWSGAASRYVVDGMRPQIPDLLTVHEHELAQESPVGILVAEGVGEIERF